jgi:predicted deacylase
VVVTANVHGDEVTGLGVVHWLAERLPECLLKGQVHLYPSLNPDGLASRCRRVPADDQDLNRLFPGDLRGTPTERLAHLVWQDISARKPQAVIDIHADAPQAIPYALVDRAVSLRRRARSDLESRSHALAAATGLTVLNEFPDEAYIRFRLDRSLAGAVTNLLHVPAVTIEAGPRLILDATAIALTSKAVLGILTCLGMANEPAPLHATRHAEHLLRRHSGPRAQCTGILIPQITPGTKLRRGHVVAEVRDLSGGLLECLRTGEDAVLIALPERAWVVPGVAVGTLAVRES